MPGEEDPASRFGDESIDELAAIERLASDPEAFAIAVKAYRAADPKLFREALTRAELLPRLELVCNWLCTKEWIVVWSRVCYSFLPKQADRLPSLAELAKATARLAEDEGILEELLVSVERRDPQTFAALLTKLELAPYCAYISHWVWRVWCRFLCERLTTGVEIDRRVVLAELSSTAKAVSQLAAEPGLVDRLSHAIELGDCGLVQAALVSVGSTERCSIICHWACGWRAIRFCWPVCLPWFVREPQIADIDEMREFARATAVLVERPELLDKLDAFVSSGQRDEYLNLVKKLGLERYCLQLCHWLFYRVCRRLCRCECRAEDIPHWLRLETFDIHPAAGNPGASFSPEGYAEPGGGFYVFGGGVHLGGNSPLVDVATGNAIAYRFLFGEYTWNPPGDNPAALPSVAPAAMTPIKAEILPTLVGYLPYTDGNGVGQYQPVTIGPADADPDGWIQIDNKMITVPMYNPVGATAVLAISPSNWIRTFDLMVLNTAAITSQHPVKLAAGLIKADAGRSLTTAEEEPIRRYRLVFEAKDNVSGAPIATDVLEAVIFDNSQVIWALDLEELRNDACNPLAGQAQAHILYTVDYPHLRSFGVSIGNNLGTVHPPVPAASGFPTVAMPSGAFASPDWYFRGGASGPHLATGNGGVAVNIATDPRCAYRVVLSWQTRRFGDLPGSTEILYCK